jgi:aspartyl/asparaginyl-tRNA synthetase
VKARNRSVIEKSMRLAGINSADHEFYLSIVDGAVRHGGFCLGFDRLIAKLLDFETVSEAVIFPRTFEKFFHRAVNFVHSTDDAMLGVSQRFTG